MSDLISRMAAIGCLGNSPEQMCMPWSEVERMLRELPTIDAVPVVHGHWIIYPDVCVCSECNEDSPSIFKYCPNCGATMDEEAKEGWE